MGKHLDVIFVDFSKAFDRVSHARLLVKLSSLGVSGRLLHWIADFLRSRTFRVQINNAFSDPVPMTSGVQQGSVLGPELFKAFINDLPDTLGVDCLLYADDLKLWGTLSNVEEADHLQSALDALHAWSISWGLPINQEKCFVLSIGSPEPFGTYHIGGRLLQTAMSGKDLGVTITSDFRTGKDTVKRVTAANRLLGAIRRSFANMTPPIFRVLFSSYVRPILEYGYPAVYPLFKYEAEMIESPTAGVQIGSSSEKFHL